MNMDTLLVIFAGISYTLTLAAILYFVCSLIEDPE